MTFSLKTVIIIHDIPQKRNLFSKKQDEFIGEDEFVL